MKLTSFILIFFSIVGVIARHPSYLPFIRAALTPEAVQDYFKHLFEESDLQTCQVYRCDFDFIKQSAMSIVGGHWRVKCCVCLKRIQKIADHRRHVTTKPKAWFSFVVVCVN